MYTNRSNGPRLDPWGIPASTCVHGEVWPLKTILYFPSFKKPVARLKRLLDITFCFSLFMSKFIKYFWNIKNDTLIL